MALAAFFALPLAFPGDTTTAVAARSLRHVARPVPGHGRRRRRRPDPAAAPPHPAQPGAPAAQAPAVQGNYATYGMSGQFWHTHLLGCDDIAAVMGNAMANTVFLWAKALDRLTITTYQAAATEGPLESIKNVVDDMVVRLADAMSLAVPAAAGDPRRHLAGLVRADPKRATTTAEGVI
ncbi:hypothetical protein [Streptosporangium vulgare]|uniref:hypothetical protein n=1 Tax=Streptosporangium vulgare TaxID=46190 RepID=UPI0031D156BD